MLSGDFVRRSRHYIVLATQGRWCEVSFDNERYNRHMAECERRDKAADAVTDEAIGEYIREELLDEMSGEKPVATMRKEWMGWHTR
jgi:hypothetical protein